MVLTTFFYFNLIMMSLAMLATENQQTKQYSVKKIPADIVVTGKGDDPQWQTADPLTDFCFPWENEDPLPTSFRALHNENWLYCLFEVTDPDVYIHQNTGDKWEVASSSRAEIFFKIDDQLMPYYCLEIDPLGRVLDYKGNFYRKFDGKWAWPEGHLVVKSHTTDNGYTVEAAFTKLSLTSLQLLKGNRLNAGLFRADCFPGSNGKPVFKWASWIRPDSPTPDFHIPSAFGLLQLER